MLHLLKALIAAHVRRTTLMSIFLVAILVSIISWNRIYMWGLHSARDIVIVDWRSLDVDTIHNSESLSDEKFLAYLPHSGLHNQRIALENAVTLASLTNRTLLVPPARLGPALRHVRFEKLKRQLANSMKDGLGHCALVPPSTVTPLECIGYHDFSNVAWSLFTNISKVPAARLLHRWNMTDAWLSDVLGVMTEDTLFIEEEGPYDFRFVDVEHLLDYDRGRYGTYVGIDALVNHPARLIHLGTLFGSARLHLTTTQAIEARTRVRESMTFTSAFLDSTGDAITKILGGEQTFVGAHVRLGDGQFLQNSQDSVRLLWWTLMRDAFGYNDTDTLALEKSNNITTLLPPPQTIDFAAARTPHPPLPPLPVPIPKPTLRCPRTLHSDPQHLVLNTPLFIASDQPQSPHLASLRDTFPCLFTLSDFQSIGNLHLKNAIDGVELTTLFSPIIEAMIVARAARVVGTKGSTFSKFIADVMWRKKMGFEIVQRG